MATNRSGNLQEVRDATMRYRDEADAVGEFISDCCQIAKDATVSVKELYNRYSDWCEANGDRAMPKNAFGGRPREREFSEGRTRKRRDWRRIGLGG